MADRFDEETRSHIMSKIRGKWTSPEKALHNLLKGNRVKHTMHPEIFGNPDAYIKELNTVVFVDGCFWHGCPEHSHATKTNKSFWNSKIARNMERDTDYTKRLGKMGYNVVRIWECELKANRIGKIMDLFL